MQLIKYFHELSLHPKNAKELKGLILQLAVQGKLTRDFRLCHPELREEPHSASAILEQIKAEKKQLIKEKKIKKEKPLPAISPEEIPFDLPEGWVWCRLGDYIHNFGQKQPDRKFTYVDVGSINNKDGELKDNINVLDPSEAPSRARKIVKKGCVIYSTVRPYLLNVAIIDREFEYEPIVSTAFSVLNPLANCSSEYLFFFLRSESFIEYVERLMIGVAYPAINDANLMQGIIPVPPLPEQKAIVETVNRLFKEVEQLEQLTVERIQLKEQFATSALNQLATNNTAREWAFLQEHFHPFFNHQPNIKKLRETILQLAVQGKLTSDFRASHSELCTGSNSASALLDQIKAEKARLVKEGKMKKEKPLPAISEEEIPYGLPEGWVWCRLGEINYDIHYGYTASARDTFSGIRMLRITDIQNNRVDWESVPDCDITEKDFCKHELKENDILIARTGGTIGKSYQVRGVNVKAVFASYLIRAIPVKMINPEYEKLFIETPLYWQQLKENSQGTGQPNVNATSLKGLLVPLPPFPEQKAIVDTIKGLMAVCDQLEQEVLQSEKQVELLMKGVLREVLGSERNN